MNIFHSASLKLTAWYLSILMVISLVFSVIVYSVSSAELGRSFPPRGQISQRLFIDPEAFEALREERVREGKAHLVGNLFVINLGMLILGGGASYFLSRRTLSPIQEAMDAQGRFISDASHELRTPLTAMQTEIEVALRGKNIDKATLRKQLESNLEEVHALRGLTDRLLQLSNGHDMAMSAITLDEPAINALNRVLVLAQGKEIAVENNIPPLTVHANSESLSDVITILLDNAVKYSPRKTTVRLHAAEQGRHALVTIIDEGIGIKASDLPHIFDRFYRADLSRSKNHVEGHGLGLAIAKRIVDAHEGTITADSVPGKGTTFTIKLPLAKTNP